MPVMEGALGVQLHPTTSHPYGETGREWENVAFVIC